MTETAEVDTPVGGGGDAPRGRKKKAKAPPPEKNKVGRPSKYAPVYAKIAAQMCKLGATDADLAAAFGVTTVTIWNWQSRYPERSTAPVEARCDLVTVLFFEATLRHRFWPSVHL